MGGEGSIQGMIVSLRNNTSMLRKTFSNRKNTFEKNRELYYRHANTELNLKKATEEELAAVRAKIIRQRKFELIKIWTIIGVLVPLFSFLGYKAATYKRPISAIDRELPKLDSKRYEFYIIEGDEWMNRKKYQNAIIQYNNALIIYPNDSTANFKLAKAYTSICSNNHTNCAQALSFINNLLCTYPKSIELYKMRANYYLSAGETDKATSDYDMVEKFGEE